MISRVLIADDHTIVRDRLRLIVDAADGFAVAGEASNGASYRRHVITRRSQSPRKITHYCSLLVPLPARYSHGSDRIV